MIQVSEHDLRAAIRLLACPMVYEPCAKREKVCIWCQARIPLKAALEEIKC